jgi:hypothetical protein
MNGLYVAALEAQRFFRKKKWRFCIIGGMALARWGEPRATKDVDFTVLAGFGNEERVVRAILGEFQPRIPDAREFALANRVLLCQASNGEPMDIALGGLPFEERVVARASSYGFAPKVKLVTASAEDLVTLKAFADRELDWFDVKGIIVRQGKRLDWDCITAELTELCELKEDMGPLKRIKTLRRELEKA